MEPREQTFLVKPSATTRYGGALFACVFLAYSFVNLQRGQMLWVFVGIYASVILAREVLRTFPAWFHIRLTPESLVIKDVFRQKEFNWGSLGAFRVQRMGFQKAIMFGLTDNPKPVFPIVLQTALTDETGQQMTLEAVVAALNAQRDQAVKTAS
jgi:hypothetical protein